MGGKGMASASMRTLMRHTLASYLSPPLPATQPTTHRRDALQRPRDCQGKEQVDAAKAMLRKGQQAHASGIVQTPLDIRAARAERAEPSTFSLPWVAS
jgi:hypothetical protein